MALTINEQTELEILQTIEEQSEDVTKRIEFLTAKKEEPESEPEKEKDSSSDGCGCIYCWMKKIPEDSNSPKIVEHSLTYFKNKAKEEKFHNPKVTSMYREFMDRIPVDLMTSDVRLEDILDYFCPPELNDQDLLDSYKTDVRIESAIFEAAADFQASMTNLFLDNPCRDLFFAESIYENHLEIFRKIDGLWKEYSIEPTWQLVRVLATNLNIYVMETMKLSKKLSKQLKHKSVEDNLKDMLDRLLKN